MARRDVITTRTIKKAIAKLKVYDGALKLQDAFSPAKYKYSLASYGHGKSVPMVTPSMIEQWKATNWLPLGPACTKQKEDKVAITLTDAASQFLKNVRVLVFSPPKHGKSLFAATLDPAFHGFPAKSPTNLTKTLYVAFDPNALEGLVEQGYNAAMIDLSGAVDKELLPALEGLRKELPKLVKEKGYEVVVVDTISFLDKNLNAFFAQSYSNWDLYRMIKNTHTRFVDLLKALPCHVVVLAHAKADFAVADAVQQAQKTATDLPGSGGISSQITGETKTTYEGMVSIILPLHARKKLDKGVYVTERVVYPQGGGGFEGGSRYQRFLDKEEPANLRGLFNKIRAGAEKWALGNNPPLFP